MKRILAVVLMTGFIFLQVVGAAIAGSKGSVGDFTITFDHKGPLHQSIVASAPPKVLILDVTMGKGKHPEVEDCEKYLIAVNTSAGATAPVQTSTSGLLSVVVKLDGKTVATASASVQAGETDVTVTTKSSTGFTQKTGVHNIEMDITFTPRSKSLAKVSYKDKATCKYIVSKR